LTGWEAGDFSVFAGKLETIYRSKAGRDTRAIPITWNIFGSASGVRRYLHSSTNKEKEY
jgi:hypothetical protein